MSNESTTSSDQGSTDGQLQAKGFGDLIPEILEDMKYRSELMEQGDRETIGVPTGINLLDDGLGGLQPGLHLLAAEPGAGKTALALQIATHAARAKYPVLFVTFEEDPARLALKAICQQANLDNDWPAPLKMKKFERGNGDPQILRKAADLYASRLRRLTFQWGTGGLTVNRVKGTAVQLLKEHKAKEILIIVDYLQRWATGRKEFSEFRHQVTALVSDLRSLAMDLKSSVLVISSQNRTGQGGDDLTSLKESGDIEYSGDSVTFMVEKKPRTQEGRKIKLSIKKNRFGDTTNGYLTFIPNLGIFRDAPDKG